MRSQRSGVTVAALLLLAGVAGMGATAGAAGARPTPGKVEGVTVVRWVQRNADGVVVRRGATATLPGHRAVPPAALLAATRVATARRGHGVTVRWVRPEASRSATATR